MVAVIEDSLLIKRTNLFGTKTHEWHKDALQNVAVGHSGIEVDRRPVRNLQIIPRDGKGVGLWAGRDDDELEWIAAVLRNALIS